MLQILNLEIMHFFFIKIATVNELFCIFNSIIFLLYETKAVTGRNLDKLHIQIKKDFINFNEMLKKHYTYSYYMVICQKGVLNMIFFVKNRLKLI